VRTLPLLASCLLLAACRGTPSASELEELRVRAEAEARARPPPPEELLRALHTGPPVAVGIEGPGRFAAQVYGSFDAARALELARFADGFYREPGNDGFEAVLDRLTAELAAAGYGKVEGLELETLRTPLERPAWTPLSARLALVDGAREELLLEFHDPAGVARTMLPVHAPSGRAEGRAVFALEEVAPGDVLVLERPGGRGVFEQAQQRGAVALLAAGLADYNVDPSGAERHLDAIQYGRAPHPCPLPTARISRRVYERLRAAAQEQPAPRVRLEAAVRFDARELRTLVARVRGATHAGEEVVIAAHVQEPGACDNASGLAGVCEVARGLASALQAGELARPARSLVFLFGHEHAQSRIYLEHLERSAASGGARAIAGISADMLGESAALTGAVALLERLPDPGAVKPLAPDEHTAWGSRPVEKGELVHSGLALVARCALLDVAALDGTWRTAEHPYEGGSDHDEFLRRGIPGVLFWHFPDFAYHTSLDRMEHVDASELRRMASAVASAALAMADARAGDLARYLASLRHELALRTAAARAAEDEELAELWTSWGTEVRHALRELCLPSAPRPTMSPAASPPEKPTVSPPPNSEVPR